MTSRRSWPSIRTAALVDVVEAEQQAHDRGLAGARPADQRERVTGGDGEVDLAQHRSPGIIAEAHRLEAHRGAIQRERARARAVLDLGLQIEQAHQVLEIGQRLPDLAVDHSQEVERLVQLQEEGIDQDHVAHGHGARDHAAGSQDHDHRDPDRDDPGLAEIEGGERGLRADRSALVERQRTVQTVALEALVGEGLDRLVVEQAVDALGADLVVALVHLAPDADAPFGSDESEDGVGDDGHERDEGERPGILDQQDADHQRELEQGRADVEQDDAEQEGDRRDAALDHARELARAPLQVIAERQAEQVAEHPQRHEAPGGLGDLGEDRIAQLAEPGGAQAGETVGEQRRERQRERRALGLAQAIDHRLEEERHLDGDDLGGDQEDERDDHTRAQAGALARP